MQTVDPAGARALLDGEGYTYLDVRSVPEFSQGQVPGAYNIPLLHHTPGGMVPNADFLAVVEKTFPRDASLVVGCAAGGRSARACQQLARAGYTTLVNMDGGFSGRRDPMTRTLAVPGWSQRDFPVSSEPETGRSYAELAGGREH